MNKFIFTYRPFLLLLCFCTLSVFSQEKDNYEKRWQELNEKIEYQKPRNSQKLERGYVYPNPILEDDYYEPYTSEYDEIVNEEEIIYSREKLYEGGENQGIKKKTKKNKSEDFDDLSIPESDSPTRTSTLSEREGNITFLKILLAIVLILLVAFLIYQFFFKNKGQSTQNIGADENDFSREINPEEIQKGEMEIALEKAIKEQDYRLAVRIYYLLLLKILIQKNWIQWKKQKTNYHYLLEMSQQNEIQNFQKAISIFEWTWYGKKEPNELIFNQYSEFYKNFLNRLDNER